MAAYRMTPARRAALEKAQAASARKRRRGVKSRRARQRNRRAIAAVAVGGAIGGAVGAQHVVSRQLVDRRIVAKHVELANYQHERLTALRVSVYPTTVLEELPFDAAAARREAREILKANRKKKRT